MYINITSDSYMYKKTVGNKEVYVVAIKPLDESSYYILGTPFLSSMYGIFDFDKERLGIVPLNGLM